MFNTFMLLLTTALGGTFAAPTSDLDTSAASARKFLQELVELNTTNPPGGEQRAVELVAKHLKDADIEYEITEFAPGRQNITARLKGQGPEKPVLLIAHADVVGADGQSWSVDPHKISQRDGYLYGRGVADDLGMAAVNLEVFLQLKHSGLSLRRDVIFALTGDEESGGGGVQHVLRNKPESLAAAIAFNELGGPMLGDDGNVRLVSLQSAEKTYKDFELVTHGKTGHASVPLADNAIYRLARALDRIGKFKFPARLLPVTRAYFAARAAVEPPVLAKAMRALAASKGALPAPALKIIEADPILSASLHTTCVATVLSGGTRVNALPAEAKASLNCRILPDESGEDVQRTLTRLVGDSDVEIQPIGVFGKSEPSPVTGVDIDQARVVIAQMWPGVPIIPFMSLGATDSRYLRQAGTASYGMNPLPMTEGDMRRAHGVDERIPVASLRTGVEFLYKLMYALAVKN
ncbi:MAG: M20/M25/M40 family metallo-hydrolase [Deltaproteobacteria bacterium]|nr:M20/M25/M40 family metallo-hydrolase [Deltaproteobacteria bacterium]